MATVVKIVQEANGEFRAYATGASGSHGHLLGLTLAEVRQAVREELNAVPEHDARAIRRAVMKAIRAAGLDPQTATLAQLRTAIETSALDV